MEPLPDSPEHVIRNSTVCLQLLVAHLCPHCQALAERFQRYFRELEAIARRLTETRKKGGESMKIDFQQLEFMNPVLRTILEEIEERFGEQMITSLYRIGDPGVHGTLPLRGTDLRCHDSAKGTEIEQWVNFRWSYDHERPQMQVAKYHRVDGGAWHLHIQVHKNTKRHE
jgi:hypothetical protein